MADAEFVTLQTQVTQLQKQADDQAKSWRKIRLVSAGLSLFLTVLAIGFMVTAAFLDPKLYPTAHQFTQIMGFVFLFTTTPLTLLTLALRGN